MIDPVLGIFVIGVALVVVAFVAAVLIERT